MKASRRDSREYLDNQLLSDFTDIIKELKLKGIERDVANMKFIDGLPNIEIASRIGISENHVNKVLRRIYDRTTRLRISL